MWCAAIVALVVVVLLWPRTRDGAPPARAAAAETRDAQETGDVPAGATREPGARGSEPREAGAMRDAVEPHERPRAHDLERSRGPERPRQATRDEPGDQLVDRTDFVDPSVAQQLARELMPLVSECVDQAKERAHVEGTLIVQVTVAPADQGRVVVSGVTPRADNQVHDDELLECIRQSSFALDGLRAPHDFDLSIPIERE